MNSDNLLVTFVRHGESSGNKAGTLNRNDDTLTTRGREQITALDIPLPDRIFCSDETRAVESARILADRFGLPLTRLSILREKSSGAIAGIPSAAVRWDDLEGTFYTRKPEGGESVNDVLARADAFLHTIDRDAGHILVVSHGTFIRLVYCHITNSDPKTILLTKELPNAGRIVIERTNGTWTVNMTNLEDRHARRP